MDLLRRRGWGLVCVAASVLALMGGAATAHAVLMPEYADVPVVQRSHTGGSEAPSQVRRGPASATSTEKGTGRVVSRVRLMLGPWKFDFFALAWFLAVLVLEVVSATGPPEPRLRFASYSFGLSVFGVAGVIWAFRQVGFHWYLVASQYWIAAACVISIFLIAGLSRREALRRIVPYLGRDLALFIRHSATWAAIAVFLGALVVEPQPGSGGGIPTGAGFDQWFLSQPREPGLAQEDSRVVSIVKFNDYQCPPCKAAHERYANVVEALIQEYGNAVQLHLVDFPLERECNPYVTSDLHPAACEAAVAVRLAREHGRGPQMEEWLWDQQASLSPDIVLKAAVDIGYADDIKDRYASELSQIRASAERGHDVGVVGTPTYFVDGLRLPLVSAQNFGRAIRDELQRIGSQSKVAPSVAKQRY
jgi:DSBA-like thioredoxin domain